MRHNGLVRQVTDPELGVIEVVAPPIKLARTPALHTDPVDSRGDVRETGLDRRRGSVSGGHEDLLGGPLEGVRVVELATHFASPVCQPLPA